jgi:GntR family transcriptional regulator
MTWEELEVAVMKLTRPVPMWQQVADHVRAQILDGTYQPGQPLPSEEALSAEFGVSRPTIREGIKTLVTEGLVQVARPRGTIVLDPFGRPARTDQHTAASARDGDGWTDVGEPTFYRVNASADQADLLRISAGEPLLARGATQESGGLRRLSCVYLPFSIAADTSYADDPQLPPVPQLYERLQEVHPQLAWTEHIRARMPVGDEATQIQIPPGVALLVVLRICHATKGRNTPGQPLAVEETRHRADQIGLAYNLR